jgi:hypothetical protein
MELANYLVQCNVSFIVYFRDKLLPECKLCPFSDKCLWFNIKKETEWIFLPSGT